MFIILTHVSLLENAWSFNPTFSSLSFSKTKQKRIDSLRPKPEENFFFQEKYDDCLENNNPWVFGKLEDENSQSD